MLPIALVGTMGAGGRGFARTLIARIQYRWIITMEVMPMTYEEKVRWLQRYRKALRNENLLRERINTARERATSISQAISPIAVHGGLSDKMAACMERIEEYQLDLAGQILRTESIREEIDAALDTLTDTQRAVLYERYILGKSIVEISNTQNLCARRIYQIHRKAISELL